MFALLIIIVLSALGLEFVLEGTRIVRLGTNAKKKRLSLTRLRAVPTLSDQQLDQYALTQDFLQSRF
jgi:hypothetical protein